MRINSPRSISPSLICDVHQFQASVRVSRLSRKTSTSFSSGCSYRTSPYLGLGGGITLSPSMAWEHRFNRRARRFKSLRRSFIRSPNSRRRVSSVSSTVGVVLPVGVSGVSDSDVGFFGSADVTESGVRSSIFTGLELEEFVPSPESLPTPAAAATSTPNRSNRIDSSPQCSTMRFRNAAKPTCSFSSADNSRSHRSMLRANHFRWVGSNSCACEEFEDMAGVLVDRGGLPIVGYVIFPLLSSPFLDTHDRETEKKRQKQLTVEALRIN
mmetsp:Transcript_31688/g.36607  ORF Transcript_31688/g.36607 Transcript_31688/m.36607 type:complete len:269 (-) Transcript_31688:33-839(-)